MSRSPEELQIIAEAMDRVVEAAKTLAICEEDEVGVDDAAEELFAARNDLYDIIGGCEDLKEAYGDDDWLDCWPDTIEVPDDNGGTEEMPLTEYEDALWERYGDKLDSLAPQQITFLLDGPGEETVLPGFLIYGEKPTPEELPQGFHCYAVRSDDDQDNPITLAENVIVNRLGWFVTPLEKPEIGEIDILDWNYID